MHYVETGRADGGTVILCHGWPEIWYSWRNQIDPIADCGYRVLALDQRGFGQTDVPKNKDLYSLEYLTKDIVALMDQLNIQKAVLIGHDWGSPVVFAMAFHYPERVEAIGSYAQPFDPVDPNKNPWEELKRNPGLFDYQIYFHELNAVHEWERDVPRSFKGMMRSANPKDRLEYSCPVSMGNVTERGGFFVGFPEDIPRPVILSEEDLDYYVKNFEKTGFFGSLCWYRNSENNWKFNIPTAGKTTKIPTLMVAVDKDLLFPPEASEPMKKVFTDLKIELIRECGHWIEEQPEKLNKIITDWLLQLPKTQTQ